MIRPTRRQIALGLGAAPFLLAAARGGGRGAREIAYSSAHPRNVLDLYARPDLEEAPMVLYVHGGGWNIGDKSRVNDLPRWAARHGFLLASANYRLTPEVNARGCAEDVAAAAAWMLANGAEHGGDPKRLFLLGHSAGAHLVALVGVDPTYLGAHGKAPSDLAGVIPIDGAGYDAVKQMRMPQRPGFLGRRLEEMYDLAFGDDAAAVSPTLLVKPGQAYPPFLIFHVASRADAREQSQELARVLRAAGGRARVVSAPGETHRSINMEFGQTADPEGERAARFIRTGQL